MAAIDQGLATRPTRAARSWRRRLQHALARLSGLVAGLLTGSAAVHAAALPEDTAETMFHSYDGGGVHADGPAFLVRKSLADRVSLTGQYYVDAVSNASIDVVTTASPFRETRKAYELGATTVVRDATLSMSVSRSREPDYLADDFNLDSSQEVFGGMTTVSLGFTRGHDMVGKKNTPGWIDQATHWQYRTGLTQILSPRWLVSLNAEAIADSGYLGSPYRAARVFGADVPERNPRTRSSRAVDLRSIYDTDALLARSSVQLSYRNYWDNWAIRGQTFQLGGSKYLGEHWLLDTYLRHYSQGNALFYSDNASTDTLYVSRNRQLSAFNDTALSVKVSYDVKRVPAGTTLKLSASAERQSYRYSNFTDLRTGQLYHYDANVLQLFATATF